MFSIGMAGVGRASSRRPRDGNGAKICCCWSGSGEVTVGGRRMVRWCSR